MRRALVLSFSDLRADPRVRRQLTLLCGRFDVTAIGSGCPDYVPVQCLRVPAQHWTPAGKLRAALFLAFRRYERAYASSRCVSAARAALQGMEFDLVVANDIWTLPLALELKGNAKVLFDAHEYAPLEFEESWKWRFFFRRYNEYLCRRYVPLADAATTVCNGIAEEYRRMLGVSMAIVHNAPHYQNLQPHPESQDGAIRLVHHGGAIPSRNIETMIDMMKHVDHRFSMDLFLVPSDPRYLEKLRGLAAGQPRVRILPPVPMTELPEALNAYDVGVYLLQPNNFNNEHALPNKFFEFIQGRVAVAIGPSPEMAKLVREYDCGVVADDFAPATLARELVKLTPGRIAEYKMNAHRAAEDLCYENTSRALLATVHKLLGDG